MYTWAKCSTVVQTYRKLWKALLWSLRAVVVTTRLVAINLWHKTYASRKTWNNLKWQFGCLLKLGTYYQLLDTEGAFLKFIKLEFLCLKMSYFQLVLFQGTQSPLNLFHTWYPWQPEVHVADFGERHHFFHYLNCK